MHHNVRLEFWVFFFTFTHLTLCFIRVGIEDDINILTSPSEEGTENHRVYTILLLLWRCPMVTSFSTFYVKFRYIVGLECKLPNSLLRVNKRTDKQIYVHTQ